MIQIKLDEYGRVGLVWYTVYREIGSPSGLCNFHDQEETVNHLLRTCNEVKEIGRVFGSLISIIYSH